jgi:hypothetical protein
MVLYPVGVLIRMQLGVMRILGPTQAQCQNGTFVCWRFRDQVPEPRDGKEARDYTELTVLLLEAPQPDVPVLLQGVIICREARYAGPEGPGDISKRMEIEVVYAGADQIGQGQSHQ